MIKFQQQPTMDSCTSACLAMILDVSVDSVIHEYHEKHLAREMNAAQFLESKGVQFEVGNSFQEVEGCGLYLLTVPSLNLQAINHNILYLIWPAKEPGTYYHQVFDPNKGRDEKKFYELAPDEDDGELAIGIGGRVVDLVIRDIEKYIGNSEAA